VPFPQRDLHIRSGRLPIDLSPEAQQFLQGLSEKSAEEPRPGLDHP
jgi:hypothetical protein